MKKHYNFRFAYCSLRISLLQHTRKSHTRKYTKISNSVDLLKCGRTVIPSYNGRPIIIKKLYFILMTNFIPNIFVLFYNNEILINFTEVLLKWNRGLALHSTTIQILRKFHKTLHQPTEKVKEFSVNFVEFFPFITYPHWMEWTIYIIMTSNKETVVLGCYMPIFSIIEAKFLVLFEIK